jgi:hypothetical protein
MQCLTDLIFLLVAVETIFENPQSALLYRYFWQSLKSYYPVFSFLPRWQIKNLGKLHYLRWWALPRMNVSLFVIWATWCYKSSSMPGGLQWMYTHRGLLHELLLDMRLHGDSIYSAEVRALAALASCVSCVIRFSAIHQNLGSSSLGKHLLAKANIAKLNELTQSEVRGLTSSTVDEIALAILTMQRSWGITMECSQKKIIFDIQLGLYWPKWQTKRSKLAANDFETSSQDMWNRYHMLECVPAHRPWNAISNQELQR